MTTKNRLERRVENLERQLKLVGRDVIEDTPTEKRYVVFRLTCIPTRENYVGIVHSDLTPAKAVDGIMKGLERITKAKSKRKAAVAFRKHPNMDQWRRDVIRVTDDKEEALELRRKYAAKANLNERLAKAS